MRLEAEKRVWPVHSMGSCEPVAAYLESGWSWSHVAETYAMVRLIGVVISIGLLDSLNPTTVAPALYLATGERGRRRVVEFTVAVFTVYLLGGVAIALGPGRLYLAALPHPSHQLEHILEIAVGAAMVTAAVLLWWDRQRLARRRLLPANADRG